MKNWNDTGRWEERNKKVTTLTRSNRQDKNRNIFVP